MMLRLWLRGPDPEREKYPALAQAAVSQAVADICLRFGLPDEAALQALIYEAGLAPKPKGYTTPPGIPTFPSVRPRLQRGEAEILRRWLAGETLDAMSLRFEIESKTVERYLRGAYQVLGVNNDAELREYVHQHGFPDVHSPNGD